MDLCIVKLQADRPVGTYRQSILGSAGDYSQNLQQQQRVTTLVSHRENGATLVV